MYDDGICYLGNGKYSLTFSVQDTNYCNVTEDLQVGIVERYCKFFMALDESVQVQIHIQSKPLSRSTVALKMAVPDTATDDQKQCLSDYNDMIDERLTGADAYIQEKYVTFTVKEPDYIQARRHFDRINLDILSILRSIGCQTAQLEKIQLLYLLRECYRPDDLSEISWLEMARTGIYDKDLIAPYGIDTAVQGESYIKLGDYYTQTLFFSDFAREMSDTIIQQIMGLDEDILITINVQPQDPFYAAEQLKRRLKMLDIEKGNSISRQSKAGILIPEPPRELQATLQAAEKILHSLQARDEKLVLANILVFVRGKTIEDVDAIAKSVRDRVAMSCAVRPFRFDHENGMNSALPLGRNDTFVSRTFTTTAAAAFVPFNVVEIVEKNGFSYGRNMRSNNIISLNRKNYENAHGFYFGTSGSGKSMGAKAEIWECYWRTKDDILIIDPDGEFLPLVELLGGEVIDVSNASPIHFNPFDINEFYGGEDDPNPLPMKSDFIISLIEVMLNIRDGMDPVTKSIVDKCVREIYQPYMAKPRDENIPTFEDFYNALLQQEDVPEAKTLATSLEIYVHGSLNLFNGRTNIDTSNRILCFRTKNLGKQLRTMAMAIIQDFCWNRISKNQELEKTTWLWNDEIHHSLRHPTTAEWLHNIWKRGRKYGLIATGITQEVRDVCASEEYKTLIANSEFIMLYRQKPDMIDDLEQVVPLSGQQIEFLLQCDSGTGLYKAKNAVVEFSNTFKKGTKLYEILSTTVGRDR